ncbi:hypothetical protein D3C86_1789290 [compost metagenome]
MDCLDLGRPQQAPLFLVQRATVGILEVWRASPIPVIAVNPAVVRAFEVTGIALVLMAQFGTTMPTVVEQHVDLAIVITGDDDLVDADTTQHVIALLGNLRDMGHEDPVAGEDALHLRTEHRVVAEDLDGQQTFVHAL